MKVPYTTMFFFILWSFSSVLSFFNSKNQETWLVSEKALPGPCHVTACIVGTHKEWWSQGSEPATLAQFDYTRLLLLCKCWQRGPMFCSYWNRYWGYSFSFTLCNSFSKLCESCSFVFNSLQPYGLQPAKVLSPWNSSCQNTGVGSHFLLQGLPNPGIGHRSPELQADSLAAELSGKAFSKLIYDL